MKIAVNGKRVKITDDDKDEKKILVKHKGKKFADLTQAEVVLNAYSIYLYL